MWPKGNYNHTITINTYANSTLVYTVIFPLTFEITFVGDVNEDRKVDIKDIATAAIAFGSYYHHLRYNPNADVNCDEKIDIKDLAIIAQNFGKTDP